MILTRRTHARLALATLRRTSGDYEAAEAAFRRSVALHDRNWRAHLSLGNFLAQNQRYQDAIESCTRITEIIPDEAVLAAVAFRNSLELNPKNYRALMYLSIALAEQGDESGAKAAANTPVEVIEGLVEVNPKDAYVISNGAGVLVELGVSERAIDEFVRSLEMGYPRDLFLSGTLDQEVLEHPRVLSALGSTPPPGST